MQKIFLPICLFLFFVSCGMYKTNDLIDKCEVYIQAHKENFEKLMTISDSLAKDSCTIYSMEISNVTDRFVFSKYDYDSILEAVSGYDLDISESNQNQIRRLLFRKIENLNFCKNVYISFELDYRNYNSEYAHIVYFKDQKTFKQLFPDFIFIDSTSTTKINEKDKWFYSYNDHWGVTTNSTFFMKTPEECARCLKRNEINYLYNIGMESLLKKDSMDAFLSWRKVAVKYDASFNDTLYKYKIRKYILSE